MNGGKKPDTSVGSFIKQVACLAVLERTVGVEFLLVTLLLILTGPLEQEGKDLIEENPKRGNVHPPVGWVDDGWNLYPP